jgi:nucleotide-binding universal stress UspA family protein
MIRRILLALGREFYAETVIRRGVELARRHGAQLTAVAVLDLEFWKGSWESAVPAGEFARRMEARPWRAAERRRDDLTDRFTRACTSAGVPHRMIHPDADPLARLVAEARYHDLLVFGLRGLFDQAVVPDPEAAIAWLIRHDVSPIVAVGPEYREVRRVLIAYHGSAQSADAMKRFIQLRPWPEADVRIAAFEAAAAAADDLLDAARDYCRAHDVEPELLRGAGPAHRELLPLAARHDADLLVLADSYRSLLLHTMLGDTTRHIIRHADRPLFLTH